MGLFSGSTKTTSNESFDSGPSSWQKPYLDQSFGGAQDAYNASKGTGYYDGDTYAGMSPEAKKAMQQLSQYATGTGLGTANQMSAIGTNLSGYSDKAGGMVDRYLAMAEEDPTQSNIDAAQKYAANPYMEGQIDAVGRDIRRNLTEEILPNIDRSASAGGNINSSRAGIASGIAQRGAADNLADVSSQMRGQAYDRGLTLAQTDRQSKMDAFRGASSDYASLGAQGIDAMARGTEVGYGAFDRINAANTLDQQDRQGQLDADYAKWKGDDEREWDILGRYNSIVGDSQWGQSGTSNSTSKTKNKGSILGQIAGAASTAAGIYSGFK